MGIFREEAVAARSARHALGAVRMATPRSLRLLVAAGIASTILLLSVGLALPYGRSLTATGEVLAHNGREGTVQAWVSESAVPDINPGMAARVHYRALPRGTQQWDGGVVTDVSRVPRNGPQRGLYRVEIQVSPADRTDGRYLSAGMIVDVRLLTQRRPMYRWVFGGLTQ
ncbi:hypothetical protein LL965_20555 [Xanthomonas cassavae CFBP 4642]|uniref:AprE-like beta-barrel domain-containing protein n=1 Tax=Xanthomonas cassavae CFBP 4642 TaxID=1219375 RepID=A0ABS8HNL1_9XANT|nr:hypothetical protein [Xanthomonas cassavae]MCC4622327.1 hypothetical protein [Xanthomonas cassavae CFBP 4642]